MIEDSLIPIQQDQLVRSALRFANKIDKKAEKPSVLSKDCISAIGAGTGSSVTASGKSLAFDGTEFVISGSGGPGIGTYIFYLNLIQNLLENSKNDIINAKAQVEQYNYMPDTLLVHPLAKTHIEKLPHFTSLMHYGEPILQEGLIAVPGKFGDIMGLDAYASINCPTGSAYVLSRGRTSNILGQYNDLDINLNHIESPMGMFVEKELIKMINCLICNKPIEKPHKTQKYCSLECYWIAKSDMMKGSKNPKYGRNKGKDNPMYGKLAWSHGLTKETNEIIYKTSQKNKGRFSGDKNPSKRPEVRQKIRKARINQKFQTVSSLDKKFQEMLEKENISDWIPQYPCEDAFTIMDFAFPKEKIAIYCDGGYWHNRPEVVKRDNAIRHILKRKGWYVLQLWEKDINQYPDKCLNYVYKALQYRRPITTGIIKEQKIL